MSRYEKLVLRAYWYYRPLTGGEYIGLVREFLQRLKSQFIELSEFHIVTDKGTNPIDADFGNLQKEIVRWLPEEWSYINKDDPDNYDFTLESTAGLAFSSGFTNGVNPSDTPVCYMRCSMGCPGDNTNNFIIELTPDMESADFVNKLFMEMLNFWKPDHALVCRRLHEKTLKSSPSDIGIGWLSYIRGSDVLPCIPSQCATELINDGVLVRTSPDIPSQDGAEILPTLLSLRDGLQKADLLKAPWVRYAP